MDEFNPKQTYHPEDEYAPIETPAERTQTAEAPREEEKPQMNEAPQNAQPQQPVYQQPAPPAYGYAPRTDASVYPPQSYGQPTPYPQQNQQPYAPVYPQGYPQQPVYQQPAYQQPVSQQYAPYQPPVQAPPTAPPPAENANPYIRQPQTAQPYSAYAPAPKPQTSTGTKVFIIILIVLLAITSIGFFVYVASHGDKGGKTEQNSFDIPFDNGDSGNNDNGNDFGLFPDSIGGTYKEIEAEITLKPDNGETHKRDDDNKDTIGTPDENAPNITLEKLPADKDNEKYTTQNAYESVSSSVVTLMCYNEKITDNEKDIVSQGTGTIISADGYIVTNAHVIGNGYVYAINIVTNDNKSYPAKVIGYDTWTDLAVLKIDAKNLKQVTFGDSSLINIGDEVIAIGSPGGVKFQNSLTRGIVSAVDRELSINKYVRYIQSDAAISPGNSGGPLCNKYGQVIGITTAKTVAAHYESMSFSIPSETVEEILGDLIHYGYVRGRTRIGFSGTEIDQQQAMYYGVPTGVVISEIDESGSLAGTDIKANDIVTEFDGEAIASFQDIYNVLANHKPGDKVKIKVQRPE